MKRSECEDIVSQVVREESEQLKERLNTAFTQAVSEKTGIDSLVAEITSIYEEIPACSAKITIEIIHRLGLVDFE